MTKASVRWVLNSDISRLVQIENMSFTYPWESQDFLYYLQRKDFNGIVVENKKTKIVVGHMMFQIVENKYKIINMAIDPLFRRQGYGAFLIKYLQKNLSNNDVLSKSKIEFIVSDQNLDFHLFAKQLGFKAVKVTQNFYGQNHDGYNFVYSLEQPVQKPIKRKSAKTK